MQILKTMTLSIAIKNKLEIHLTAEIQYLFEETIKLINDL